MKATNNVVDKAAMILSGGLMLLGIVVLGFVEILAGQPYGAAPVTNEAGEVVATPFVPPELRTGLVLLGLAVLLLWGLYRFTTSLVDDRNVTAPESVPN